MKVSECLRELQGRLDSLAPMAGDRLPPERDLAALIGCSRQTLRAALAQMMRDDLVWRHVGQGTFRGPRPKGRPVRDSVLIELTSPLQLLEARLVLEPPVAAAAARAATPEDVARLMQRVADGRCAKDEASYEDADSAFHRSVAEIAGNPVLSRVLGYLSDVRRRSAWQRARGQTYRRIGLAEFRGHHSDQHAAVAEAIAAGNAEAADAAMRTHLETISATMRSGTGPA